MIMGEAEQELFLLLGCREAIKGYREELTTVLY